MEVSCKHHAVDLNQDSWYERGWGLDIAIFVAVDPFLPKINKGGLNFDGLNRSATLRGIRSDNQNNELGISRRGYGTACPGTIVSMDTRDRHPAWWNWPKSSKTQMVSDTPRTCTLLVSRRSLKWRSLNDSNGHLLEGMVTECARAVFTKMIQNKAVKRPKIK